MFTTRSLTSVALAFAAIAAQADTFRLTVTNHQGQHLSPVFYSASDETFDIFGLGQPASLGIKNIAERGSTTAMQNIARQAGAAVRTFGVVPGGIINMGQSRSATFTTDDQHAYLSFATMLGETNDGFLGESVSSMNLLLFNKGFARSFTLEIYGDRAWDSGTELNTQNRADLVSFGGGGNPAEAQSEQFVRVHETIVPGRGDYWQFLPDWDRGTLIATIKVQALPRKTAIQSAP